MSRTVFVRQSAACKTLVKVDTALLCLHRYHAILSNASPRPALLKSREQMGKTGKKVKTNRINAIRKQYDAFLEEDKKRRDRNEYILERLDKMRSSSAMVQIRHPQPTNIFTDFNDPVKYDKSQQYIGRSVPIYEKQRYSFNQVSPTMLTTLNEEDLVKELSKKYILIPKQQSMPVYENIYNKYPIKSCVEDNNDWRSKYNILEELKKSEVEQEGNSKSMLSTEFNTNNDSNAECGENNVDETNVKKIMQINDPELILKMDNNFEKASFRTEDDMRSQNTDIEKDLSNTTKPLLDTSIINKNASFNEDSKCIKNIKDDLQYTDILTEKEKLQTKHEIESKSRAEEKLTEEVHNNLYSNINVGHQEHFEPLRHVEITEHEEIKNLQMQSNTNAEEEMSEVDCTTVHRDIADIVLNETSSGVNEDTTTIAEEPNLSNTTNTYKVTNTKDDEQVLATDLMSERSNDIIDNQDVQSSVIENFNCPVDPGQNYEHQTNSGKLEYENTVEETQIQDFESEQNNLFYSEQTESNTYDQSGADNKNVEYTNNESYRQNENYVYYEGTPQDQLYPNEINEHEEATEQYDPNYQNQYDNYAQQDPQSESGKGYETEVNNILESQQYDTQHNYDQLLYDETNYNAVEDVKQELDAEQEYIEPIKDLKQKEVNPGSETIEHEVKVS